MCNAHQKFNNEFVNICPYCSIRYWNKLCGSSPLGFHVLSECRTHEAAINNKTLADVNFGIARDECSKENHEYDATYDIRHAITLRRMIGELIKRYEQEEKKADVRAEKLKNFIEIKVRSGNTVFIPFHLVRLPHPAIGTDIGFEFNLGFRKTRDSKTLPPSKDVKRVKFNVNEATKSLAARKLILDELESKFVASELTTPAELEAAITFADDARVAFDLTTRAARDARKTTKTTHEDIHYTVILVNTEARKLLSDGCNATKVALNATNTVANAIEQAAILEILAARKVIDTISKAIVTTDNAIDRISKAVRFAAAEEAAAAVHLAAAVAVAEEAAAAAKRNYINETIALLVEANASSAAAKHSDINVAITLLVQAKAIIKLANDQRTEASVAYELAKTALEDADAAFKLANAKLAYADATYQSIKVQCIAAFQRTAPRCVKCVDYEPAFAALEDAKAASKHANAQRTAAIAAFERTNATLADADAAFKLASAQHKGAYVAAGCENAKPEFEPDESTDEFDGKTTDEFDGKTTTKLVSTNPSTNLMMMMMVMVANPLMILMTTQPSHAQQPTTQTPNAQ